MMSKYNTLLKLAAAFLLCSILEGCSLPTKPNEPYSGPYPSGFNELSNKNPLIAKELAKLPELQDGISEEEATSLDNLVKLYDANPDKFEKAFEQMYKLGIPEVRKYCAPLQAVFWLSEDGKHEEIKKIVFSYSLENLLEKAWNFDAAAVPDAQILQAIHGINDPTIRQQYTDYWKVIGNLRLQKLLVIDLKYIEKVVSKDAREIIKNFKTENPKWSDFTTVTERLNAPELVDYYEQRRLTYVKYWEIPNYNKNGNPRWVFKNKKGNCVYTTSFTVYCLRKGGYKAWEKHILPGDMRARYHSITVFRRDGKKYVMDNGKPYKVGIRAWENYFH